MKRVIFFLLGLLMSLLVNVWAFAAPFVVCDPYTNPNAMPDEFIVELDNSGVTESIPYSLHSSGNAIAYDLDGVAPGNHTIKVWARNVNGTSEAAILNFFLPGIPAQPNNLNVLWE